MDAYTIPEAAAKLEVHPREVREWIEEGRLTAFDSVAGRRIPREELERLAEPAPPGPVVARLRAPGRLEEALDELRADLEELEGLRGEVEALRRRVDELERRMPDLAPGRSMRPALTPLFRGPGPGG